MKKTTILSAGAGLVAAAAIGITGAALANAASAPTPSASGTTAQGAPDRPGGAPMGNGNTDPTKPMRSDEKLLSGDVAAKVTAAAKAKEPGATIQRVETDSDGVYEAHLVRADGTHVTVQIDKAYAVTNVLVEGQGGPGGPKGRAQSSGQGRSSQTPAG